MFENLFKKSTTISSCKGDNVVIINGQRYNLPKGKVSVMQKNGHTKITVNGREINTYESEQKKIDKYEEISEKGVSRININAAFDVKVVSADSFYAHLSGAATDEFDMNIVCKSGVVEVLAEAKCPCWSGEVKLEVGIPPSIYTLLKSISICSGDGNVEAEVDKIEKLSIETEDGNINIKGKKVNDVNVKSEDGDINLEVDIIKSANIKVADGEVSIISEKIEILQVDTEDGDITADVENVDSIVIHANDGEIDVYSNQIGSVELETEDGDINIKARKADNVNVKTDDGNVKWKIKSVDKLRIIQDGKVTAEI